MQEHWLPERASPWRRSDWSRRKAPGLEAICLPVELHDMIDPRITTALRARFSATHEIEIIDAAARDARVFRALAGFRAAGQATALDEGRHWRGVPTRQQGGVFAPKRSMPEFNR